MTRQYYSAKTGVPTGGIPSVDAGNISVYFVLKHAIYNNRPDQLLSFMRFVDDGSGVWNGCMDNFMIWFTDVRSVCKDQYGLDLTYEAQEVQDNAQFLDIQYKFIDGKLTTDIYKKPTDANRFLEYSSCHPKHTFPSIVYSQALRYRRIINDDQLFGLRLTELREFFINSSYPVELVDEMLEKVKGKPRVLEYKDKSAKDGDFCPTTWITTYGEGFQEAKDKASELNKALALSSTWIPIQPNRVIKVVPRRAPNLKDLLFKRKAIALDDSSLPKGTVPCTDKSIKKRGAKCQCCQCVSGLDSIESNGVVVKTSGGNCKSSNIIYGASCTLCKSNNVYIGKTVQQLHDRVSGHRGSFYTVLESDDIKVDDGNILGYHLFSVHNLTDRKDFNKTYKFDIIAHATPSTIRILEQFYINKLGSRTPFGLNQIDSI